MDTVEYEVTEKIYGIDEDTVPLFTGTNAECHLFVDAYVTALINHTAYKYAEDESDEDEAGIREILLRSPLVSQGDILIKITEVTMMIELRFNFTDGEEA